MPFMRLLLTAIAIIATFLYCRKEAKEEIDYEALIECASTQSTDSTLLAGRIAGNWKLFARACPMSTGTPKDVRMTICAGRTFKITEGGIVVTQGNWRFREWGNGWQLNLTQPNNYLFGSVSVCAGKLIFSAIPVDGCNHYFSRTF